MGHQVTRVFPDLSGVSRAAAEDFVTLAREAIAQRGRFTVALSGGRTPRELHRLLATECRDQVDWGKVHIFFGDERYLPHDDPLSNYRMARETLLEQVVLPADQVHPMPTGAADPEEAARTYEATLRAQFGEGVPEFDLILLGLGADGHTASIVPGTPATGERQRLVMPVRANVEPPLRLTLTLPVLTAARRTLFLVTGADKRPVWEEIQADPVAAAHRYPAAAVAAEARLAVWYIDRSLEG
jgi:6-phosphogluconolactonase